jgi:hypothetical protein
MAAVDITNDIVEIAATGTNLTDSADFTTLVVGAGNGIKFEYTDRLTIILKNTTGGAATFTILVPQIDILTEAGVTVPDSDIVVANGKTYLVQEAYAFKDSDGYVTIECDVAGEILLVTV